MNGATKVKQIKAGMWVVDKEHQEQVRKDAERINKSMELLITDLVHSEPTYLKLNPELVSLLVDALWSTQLRPVEKYFERFPEEFERYQKLAQDIQAAERRVAQYVWEI